MAVVLVRNERGRDDEHADIVSGRPDFAEPSFGVTVAKKHPPYVFSIRGASCLVHKILRVEMQWYRISSRGLVKMKRPVLIAQTCCAQSFWLDPDISRTCVMPNPDALLCGRCHGEGATFPKNGRAYKSGLTRTEAHVKLGCVVNGY